MQQFGEKACEGCSNGPELTALLRVVAFQGDTNFRSWDVPLTISWIASLDTDFAKYTKYFMREQITGEMLPELDHSMLKVGFVCSTHVL